MLKYKIKKRWRHFKYRLLRLFFKEQDLTRMIDINRLDFVDAYNLKRIYVEKWMSKTEHDFYTRNKDIKYGLQYELARQMAEVLANHVIVSEIYDIEKDEFQCIGEIMLIEEKR